jgi:hypothetical protein
MDKGLAKRWLVVAAVGAAVLSTGVAGLDGEVASGDMVLGVMENGSVISGVFLLVDDTRLLCISGGRFRNLLDRRPESLAGV